jgi:hypothetical protein
MKAREQTKTTKICQSCRNENRARLRDGRAPSKLWTCRNCGKATCGHFCGNKVLDRQYRMATCGSCRLSQGSLIAPSGAEESERDAELLQGEPNTMSETTTDTRRVYQCQRCGRLPRIGEVLTTFQAFRPVGFGPAGGTYEVTDRTFAVCRNCTDEAFADNSKYPAERKPCNRSRWGIDALCPDCGRANSDHRD